MRSLATFLLVLTLSGCGGEDSNPDPMQTTRPTTSTSPELVVAATTTTPAPSSTTTTAAEKEPGSESISVTEKITITVTDPED